MGYKPQRWSDEDAEKVRKLIMADGYTYAQAAEEMGMTESALKGIARRKGWAGSGERDSRERKAEPVYNLRRQFQVGDPIRNTDAEVEAVRLQRRRDAEFSAMVVREAVRLGIMQVTK